MSTGEIILRIQGDDITWGQSWCSVNVGDSVTRGVFDETGA